METLLDDLLNLKINYNNLILKLLERVIIDDVVNMIRFVHYKFPTLFKNKDVKNYIKKYSKLTFNNYSQIKINKLNIKVNKRLLTRRIKNARSLKFIRNKNKMLSSYNKNDKYCNARIWNSGSIIQLDDGRTIYGGRCSRKKVNGKD